MKLPLNQIIQGDCIEVMKTFPDKSVDCVITSPPYWNLRDYGVEGQMGLEATPEEYTLNMVRVFREVYRVLKAQGSLWLNLGDSYSGGQISGNKKFGNEQFNKNRPSRERTLTPKKTKPYNLKPKDLVGIPWRIAFALQADGWILRQDIIWAKPNPMPESITDRCTKAHEYIFLLTKSGKYFFDNEAIKEPASTNTNPRVSRREMPPVAGHQHGKGSHNTLIHASTKSGRKVANAGSKIKSNTNYESALVYMVEKRNKRDVWTIQSHAYREAHFATFPEALITPMVKAGCPEGGVILDPFMGAGTTALVAQKLNRNYIGIELNPIYIEIAENRLRQKVLI